MKMAIWIKVDGTALTVSLPKDTTEAMLFIQKCVGGYYTPIPWKGGKVMLVNEEGIPRKLPRTLRLLLSQQQGSLHRCFQIVSMSTHWQIRQVVRSLVMF